MTSTNQDIPPLGWEDPDDGWHRSTCEACGEEMVVFERGQRTHQTCEDRAT
jgi:hypothetical protein